MKIIVQKKKLFVYYFIFIICFFSNNKHSSFMSSFSSSFAETNEKIRLHYLEQGKGPLVLLLHGFPETSFSWRKQIGVLAHHGYHAVAPDLPGYGSSSAPIEIERYSASNIVNILVSFLDAINEKQPVVVVGNDWGSTLAWLCAQTRPDRFRGVVALGVPLMGKAPMLPSRLFPQNEEFWFYTIYFCQPSLAEKELEKDVEVTLKKIYYAASGDVGDRNQQTPNPFSMVSKEKGLLGLLPEPSSLPKWISPQDLDVFVQSYRKSGFSGGLNYYRNLDRNWEKQKQDPKVTIPSLFIFGERDTGLAMPGMRQIIQNIPNLATDLRGSHEISGSGHWLQQEAPERVNELLIDFLKKLH